MVIRPTEAFASERTGFSSRSEIRSSGDFLELPQSTGRLGSRDLRFKVHRSIPSNLSTRRRLPQSRHNARQRRKWFLVNRRRNWFSNGGLSRSCGRRRTTTRRSRRSSKSGESAFEGVCGRREDIETSCSGPNEKSVLSIFGSEFPVTHWTWKSSPNQNPKSSYFHSYLPPAYCHPKA